MHCVSAGRWAAGIATLPRGTLSQVSESVSQVSESVSQVSESGEHDYILCLVSEQKGQGRLNRSEIRIDLSAGRKVKRVPVKQKVC